MEMIVHWMRVGFVHGVMNTDNMSILGLTLNYGPYGWMEDYAPDGTPNTTDAAGRRYAFKNQPQIALWNLGQLANAILPVVGTPEPLQEALDDAITTFHRGQDAMMAKKLRFYRFEPGTNQAVPCCPAVPERIPVSDLPVNGKLGKGNLPVILGTGIHTPPLDRP
jgi:protein adenylyltransferase